LEDLRRERISLEQHESKFVKQISTLAEKKDNLFRKGTESTSQEEQEILARKMFELGSRSQGIKSTLVLVQKHIRVVNGMINLKESEQLLKTLGLSSIINKMKGVELEKWILKQNIDTGITHEKLTDFAQLIDEGQNQAVVAEEDEGLRAIVSSMQKVQSAAEDNREAAYSQELRSASEALERKPEENSQFE